jgi:hypothetical protein
MFSSGEAGRGLLFLGNATFYFDYSSSSSGSLGISSSLLVGKHYCDALKMMSIATTEPPYNNQQFSGIQKSPMFEQ